MADTPTIYELMDKKKTPDISRGVTRVLLASGTVGRPTLATPGTPADRVGILRDVYLKALKEPELVAEANKKRLELDFLSGEELERLMREVSNEPRDVVERVRKLAE
jgi:tripartite-type tricarboxylate transporter receptor subunit TctC